MYYINYITNAVELEGNCPTPSTTTCPPPPECTTPEPVTPPQPPPPGTCPTTECISALKPEVSLYYSSDCILPSHR